MRLLQPRLQLPLPSCDVMFEDVWRNCEGKEGRGVALFIVS